MAGAGPATTGGSEERVALERLLGVVGVDGNTEQSDVGVASSLWGRRRYGTVQPVRVRLTGHDLGTVEQVEQE